MVSPRTLLSVDDADFMCIETDTRGFQCGGLALGRKQIGGSQLSAGKAFVGGVR